MRDNVFALVMLSFCGLAVANVAVNAVADERVAPAVYVAPTNLQMPAPVPPPLPQTTASNAAHAAAPVSPVVHAFTNNETRQQSRPIQTVSQEIPQIPPQLERPAPAAPLTTLPTPLPAPIAPATPSIASDDILDAPLKIGSGDAATHSRPLASGMPDVTKLVTVLGSLILVIGLFFLFSLFLKKVSPHATRTLPKEVFENLGRAALSTKIQLQLLRLGNRLVLVSVTADGTNTVTEITDPDEVMQVLGMCRRLDSTSSTNAFRHVLNGADTEYAPRANTVKPHRANDSLASLLAGGLVKS
ncbi:MAG: flagellar biosynthetic protein FliO [Thermoguttaceae bacterium]